MKVRVQSGAVVAALLLLSVACTAPALVRAHADDENLHTSIRAALLSDPRTASLSAAEIDLMVDVLSEEAGKQGITQSAIEWRPYTEASPAGASSACGSIPAFLCALNTAFGFDGSDPTIAIGLGITSALLIVIIATMLEMKRRHAAQAAPPPPTAPMPPTL